MTYLLDTHVWLWMLTAPEKISQHARSVIEDGRSRLLLSAASSWEISIKYAIGRLPLPQPPKNYVPDRMRLSGVEGLSIEHSHALHLSHLEFHHRDPFDRMLVAQAQVERIPVITTDPVFDRYDVEVLRA